MGVGDKMGGVFTAPNREAEGARSCQHLNSSLATGIAVRRIVGTNITILHTAHTETQPSSVAS
jgi:hypothetical protein